MVVPLRARLRAAGLAITYRQNIDEQTQLSCGGCLITLAPRDWELEFEETD